MIGPLETLPALSPATERGSRCIKPAVYFRRERDQIHYSCQEHMDPLQLRSWRMVDGIELGANKIMAGVTAALDLGAKVRARKTARKPTTRA